MLRRIVALAGAMALGATALAGPQAVASRAHVINAGVVILDSSKQSGGAPVSAAPYAFYCLDQARAIKPAGWAFSNPHAPTVVTNTIASRWGATAGTRITKAQAPYWEVFLSSATDSELSDYDMLLVAPRYLISLNPAEREKLRKFVDKGGLLWIDPGATGGSSPTYGVDETNNFPLPFALTQMGSGIVNDQSDFSQPLLTTPNTMSARDMRFLNGSGGYGLRPVDLSDEGAASIGPFEYPVIEDYYKLRAVSVDTQGSLTLPTISLGRIGDGYIVITARGAAINLSGGLSNGGYSSNTSGLNPIGQSAARLAINMVSLLGDFRASGGGTRKTNSSIADVTAPLLKRWEANVATSPDPNISQPVIYKGFVYVSTGSSVRCYEVNPSGLGNPSTGIVWETQGLTSPISSPVAVTVPDVVRGGTNLPEDQILVTDGAGNLVVIDGTQPQPGRASNAGKVVVKIAPPAGHNSSSSPNPPTADEGVAYMVDTAAGQSSSTAGRVWMADLRRGAVIQSGGSNWAIGGSNADFPTFGSSATLAAIPTSDNSGGVDKVLYVPFNPSGVALGPSVAGFSSIWVGVKGEKPVSYQVDTTASPMVLQVDTRALQAGNLPIYTPSPSDTGAQPTLGPRIVLYKKGTSGQGTGDVFSASELAGIFTGQVDGPDGQMKFVLKAGHDDTWFQNNVAGVRVDYTIDWGRAALNSVAQSVERGRITFSSSDTGRRILGNLAVTPRGTVFAVYGNPDMNNRDTSHIGNGGTVYAFKEDAGRGLFRCVMRYDLFPTHTINPAQGAGMQYRTNFQDLDAVQGFASGLLGGDVENMAYMGGPSVRGDLVYVLAAGQKLAGLVPVDVTVLMAFKAEPDTPTIKVGDLSDGVTLVQPDFLRTPNANRKQPTVNSLLQQAFKYERETGTIRIDNLMGINRGQIQNCLSLSQPVLVRRSGQSDTLVDPDATGGRWSPLQWYSVLHGMQLRQYGSAASIVTTPVVAGNTLYLAGTSLLPKILSSGLSSIPGPNDFKGMCWAYNVDLGSTNQFLVPTPGRAWNKQFVTLLASGSPFTPNTNVLWPQLQGITDFSMLTQRVNQTVLGSGASASHMAYGIVAGSNAAVAWGDQGVYTYTRADVLVCDQNRVARYDAAGNLLWTSDASLNSGENGDLTVGTVKPLLRPTRAYPIGGNDLLVVDSGGNRIVRMNSAGIETRSIDKIRIDPENTSAEWAPNESKSLNDPRDVTVFGEYVSLGSTPVFSNQGSVEYWFHYIIADTGNRRLVELVDRYNVDSQGRILDPVVVNGEPQLGVLYWHSPAAISGKGFAYSSLVRVYVPGTGGTGHYAYIAGIGSGTPTRSAFGLDTPVGTTPVAGANGSGGFVLFDPSLPTGSQVINTLTLPDTSSTKFWNEATNTWDVGTGLSGPVRDKAIGVVNSVSAVASGNTIQVMIADTSGVYEGTITSGTSSTSSTMAVSWMLPNAAYRALRRVDPTSGTTPGTPSADNAANLNATYARRLDSGEILIVNGYSGSTRGNKASNGTFVGRGLFLGEVIQIDGSAYSPARANLGFYGPDAIKYELRGVTNGRDIVMPVYADRR